jgi:hypothetical protein
MLEQLLKEMTMPKYNILKFALKKSYEHLQGQKLSGDVN